MTDKVREAAQKVVTALDSPQTTAYMESDAIRLLGDLRAALAEPMDAERGEPVSVPREPQTRQYWIEKLSQIPAEERVSHAIDIILAATGANK